MAFNEARVKCNIKLKLHRLEIERSIWNKILGIIVDETLLKTTKEHIRLKWSNSVAIIDKTRELLSRSCLQTFYLHL